MINKINTFSIEEKLLTQAIISEYCSIVMSAGLVEMRWAMRAFAPDDPGVKALQDFFSYAMDLQVEIAIQLAISGIPEEMRLNAPISKTVFQSMSTDKKNIIKELFDILGK